MGHSLQKLKEVTHKLLTDKRPNKQLLFTKSTKETSSYGTLRGEENF